MKKLILSIALLASFGAQAYDLISRHGRWEVRAYTDEFTDEKSVYLYELEARLVINCTFKSIIALEDNVDYSGNNDANTFITYRVHKNKAVTIRARALNGGVLTDDPFDIEKAITDFKNSNVAIFKVTIGRKSYDTKKLFMYGFTEAATIAGCF